MFPPTCFNGDVSTTDPYKEVRTTSLLHAKRTNPERESIKLHHGAGDRGLVFEIEEFALQDGPGIRTTVFLKGCPLRCTWCHNPEGISYQPETWLDRMACPECGLDVDGSTGVCTACGWRATSLPLSLRHTCGSWYSVDDLAATLRRHEDVLLTSGGGVTFSGGEPLAQVAFVSRVAQALKPLHVALETSGQASPAAFRAGMEAVDLVMLG